MAELGVNKDFRPYHDYVLILPIERGMTETGIALPGGTDVNLPVGRIMRVGPGAFSDSGQRLEMPFKEGDLVFLSFPSYSEPATLDIDRVKYLLVRARDICGTIVNVVS